MAKIVYNACFGGFGLSEAAVLRYCELKGITVFPESDRFYGSAYWLVPREERTGILGRDGWRSADPEERMASNSRHRDLTLNVDNIPRQDPALVQVVEELGHQANGMFAMLHIADMPSGTRYRIDEYDGNESVMTPDDYEWTVAA
jgi:hypothetical protein